ncbi:ABC transporter ATP-binding protein [Rhizobium sp. SSA_523]|uniref:ABC transporter ATP-binding protein n=1 Tax=Rhizobium sp. SSA_523 TaxID=2952477 RepID=UPI00209138A1|nr:ABC transporter ATP-binding protein [Rhizobium sp. SSA_523]MCO5732492.1 ABC transporter ATP-binding protein [Rhizobium sp. SSA_523]WKC22368.1 ABC transporter ATP-binding protein [Rhizobium sp. SSA_523]
MTDTLIEARNVSRRFTRELDYAERLARVFGAKISQKTVHAVDDVNLAVKSGEVVGLVGESGCGKSTLGRMMAGIMPTSEGTVSWKGRALSELKGADKRRARLAAQMIFQDPMSTLNPRKRVIDIIGEAPLVHGLVARNQLRSYVGELAQRVGLDPSYLDRYPHQFSGGQRQRIGIARALAVKPELIVCDESVAALDVSIQAQILNLFMDLRSEFGLTYLFISHDLGVVKHICDRVVVMYLGRVVETGTPDELFANPQHPYTQALVRELPSVSDRRRDFTPVRGEIPSPLHPPPGCHFHPRCPFAFDRCRVERPLLRETSPGQASACHLHDADTSATRTETAQTVS